MASGKSDRTKYEQSFQVAGILGGLTLTVLTLLMPWEAKDIPPNNFGIIINMTADTYNKINQVLNMQPIHMNSTKEVNHTKVVEDYKDLYKTISTGGMGIISSLFIVSVIGIKILIIEGKEAINAKRHIEDTLFAKITFKYIYEAGLIGLLILFPILVFPFSYIASIIILIVEVFWGITWIKIWLSILKDKKFNP